MIEVKCGTILVAHPQLQDAEFRHAVILIMRHEMEGTFGFNVAVKPVEGTSIHKSGPLPLTTPIRLRKHEASFTTSEVIADTGYSFCAVHSLEEAMEPDGGSIVLIGYAGWKEGQLAREMSMGAWIPTTVSLEAILAVPAEERWKIAAGGAGIAVDQ
jgi:putative transcriptional regulator